MTIELGGNITLSGFSERDFTELIVVKKMVGQYARKLSDNYGMDALKVTLKPVHTTKSEIHCHATFGGKDLSSEETAQNLYVALDSALKSIQTQAEKL